MIEKLLHTPEGVRDIYSKECREKAAVEERLRGVMDRFGYQQIENGVGMTRLLYEEFRHAVDEACAAAIVSRALTTESDSSNE